MKKIIHNLRNRPEEEKRHILHILTFFAGIIMLILWSFSLGKTLGNPETKTKLQEDLQPFSVLKENLVEGYSSVSTDSNSATINNAQ